jgi:hypothetical protein
MHSYRKMNRESMSTDTTIEHKIKEITISLKAEDN